MVSDVPAQGQHLWLEGATLLELDGRQARPTHMPRGPMKKDGPGFLNPAMAPARSRSVMLLTDALNHHWLVSEGSPIRILDALCATGIRVRRWRNEIPAHHQKRLRITANDLDEHALSMLIQAHKKYPPSIELCEERDESWFETHDPRVHHNGIYVSKRDARLAMLDSGYQWIDIDPFGSPIQFLDSAIQALARKGVLEVTATDTAALTGSSLSSQRRRYGAHGIVDSYAHDDAVRVLLANVALAAARHDRHITPILALFDGHHVRVTVLVEKGKEKASDVLDAIGYRVRKHEGGFDFKQTMPTGQEVLSSGPLWTQGIFNESIASRMTDEQILKLCTPDAEQLDHYKALGLAWSAEDEKYSIRELKRSIRFIAQAAPILSGDYSLFHIDDIPNFVGLPEAPKIDTLITALNEAGLLAARYPHAEPYIAFRGDDESLRAVVRGMQHQPNEGSIS